MREKFVEFNNPFIDLFLSFLFLQRKIGASTRENEVGDSYEDTGPISKYPGRKIDN